MQPITKKTYYGLGIVSSALSVLGGVLLFGGTYASLLYNIATLMTGCMFLCLAGTMRAHKLNVCLNFVAVLLLILSLAGNLTLQKVAGALAWPIFAFPYFDASEENTPVHSVSFLVMLFGGVQLLFSFVMVPSMVIMSLAVAISLAQGVLCWVLFQQEKQA